MKFVRSILDIIINIIELAAIIFIIGATIRFAFKPERKARTLLLISSLCLLFSGLSLMIIYTGGSYDYPPGFTIASISGVVGLICLLGGATKFAKEEEKNEQGLKKKKEFKLKKYKCEDCGRPINHRGKCLPCNIAAKRKK